MAALDRNTAAVKANTPAGDVAGPARPGKRPSRGDVVGMRYQAYARYWERYQRQRATEADADG